MALSSASIDKEEVFPVVPPVGPGLMPMLAAHIRDPGSSWSVGTFGALAEFHRDSNEVAEIVVRPDILQVVTPRGGLRLHLATGLRAIASESVGQNLGEWSHSVALCLPEGIAAMERRSHLAELGCDEQALRDADRSAILFDVGLGCTQVDVCVRTERAEVLAALRAASGRSVLETGNRLMCEMPRLSPHRVFLTRFARAEVFQPVPAANGVSPEGPHTHVLPALLRARRTHAATVPIPAGWVPCAWIHPAHPLRDALGKARQFSRDVHDAFQSLLAQFGDPELWAMKQTVLSALDQDRDPQISLGQLSRHARNVVRVAVRQWSTMNEHALPATHWSEAFGRVQGTVQTPSH